MFSRERVFKVPDVLRVDERFREPPAVRRHYLMLRDAMIIGDRDGVGNRQMRLLRGGYEVPIKLSQVEAILERYQ